MKCKCCGAAMVGQPWIENLSTIPGLGYLKRVAEVSLSGNHPLLIISNTDQAYPGLVAEWMKMQGGTARLVPVCPCHHYQDSLIPCKCTASIMNRHWNSKSMKTAVAASVMNVHVGSVELREIELYLKGRTDSYVLGAAERANMIFEARKAIPKISLDDLDVPTQSLVSQGAKYLNLDGFGIEKMLDIALTIAVMSRTNRHVPNNVDIAEAFQYVHKAGPE